MVTGKSKALRKRPSKARLAGKETGSGGASAPPASHTWERVMTGAWRSVEGFPYYEINSSGQVRSIDRKVWGGPRMGFYLKRGRILKPGIASHGYPTVSLGRRNSRTLHSLVAEAFLGPCPQGCEVRHKDGNRQNPRLENLEYGTRSDNMKDAAKHGSRDNRRYGLKASRTKDQLYPDWRTQVFKPGKWKKGGA